MRKLLLCAVLLMLSGCSVFSPVKVAPMSTYTLSDIPCQLPSSPGSSTLLVPVPDSSAVYNTTQMAYSCYPYQVAYFARNAWADTPARMLQPLMIQTLQNTHHFHAVLASSLANDGYILQTNLLELKQQFAPCGSVILLRVRADLIRVSNNQVVASKQFCITEPAPCCNPYGGVIAANRAICHWLRELTAFVLNAI